MGLIYWLRLNLLTLFGLPIAQGTVPPALEPVSGGAGWVGAGLLGAVLSWLLLKHLPDKDKQINVLVATFLSEVKDARNEASLVLGKEREQRHVERDQMNSFNLKMAVLLEQNTQETRLLVQQTKDLCSGVHVLVSKIESRNPNQSDPKRIN